MNQQGIFLKHMLAQQLSSNNTYAKHHENSTNSLVTDIKSQTDGQANSPNKGLVSLFIFFFFHNLFFKICRECLITRRNFGQSCLPRYHAVPDFSSSASSHNCAILDSEDEDTQVQSSATLLCDPQILQTKSSF
jgi:hypothetical protein